MNKIGVVGYSTTEYSKDKAELYLLLSIQQLVSKGIPFNQMEIVSGLTDIGIPGQAYKLAKRFGIRTVGISCALSKDFDCFPCDEVVIVGNEWGDESKTFIDRIDYLIRIGGGKQSLKETQMFKEKFGDKTNRLIEYDL
jgi:hypothetical protein